MSNLISDTQLLSKLDELSQSIARLEESEELESINIRLNNSEQTITEIRARKLLQMFLNDYLEIPEYSREPELIEAVIW